MVYSAVPNSLIISERNSSIIAKDDEFISVLCLVSAPLNRPQSVFLDVSHGVALIFLLFFSLSILLELVAYEGIKEGDHKVEDHEGDEPLPYLLNNRCVLFHLINLSLRFENSLFLLFDERLDGHSMTCEIHEEFDDNIEHVL